MKSNGPPGAALDNSAMYVPPNYIPSSQQPNTFEGYTGSPSNPVADAHNRCATGTNGAGTAGDINNHYYYTHGMPYQNGWGLSPDMGDITFNNHDINLQSLGLQQPDVTGPWLDYLP